MTSRGTSRVTSFEARRRFIRGAAVLVATAAHGSPALADSAQGSPTVRVTGLVERPTAFGIAELATFDAQDAVLRREGGDSRTYRGALLRDLVASCKPVEAGRFDLRRSYYVAAATDGYLAVFSWAELFNGPIGDAVVVAYAADGVPIADGEGPLVLVSGRDTRSGPRHVRWLSSIDVRRATS